MTDGSEIFNRMKDAGRCLFVYFSYTDDRGHPAPFREFVTSDRMSVTVFDIRIRPENLRMSESGRCVYRDESVDLVFLRPGEARLEYMRKGILRFSAPVYVSLDPDEFVRFAVETAGMSENTDDADRFRLWCATEGFL